MSDGDVYAETAREALEKWDKGESVWVIELGGIGPGYEQAIHVLVFEIIRDHLDDVFDDASPKPPHDWADATVHRVDKWPGCGFSGAQVGAAKWLAYRFLWKGPRQALLAAKAAAPSDEDSRTILVSKIWPHAPEPILEGAPA